MRVFAPDVQIVEINFFQIEPIFWILPARRLFKLLLLV